jgi:hypothetical protein
MATIMKASHQWASRPDDQRFTSLDDLLAHTRRQREISRAAVIPSRRLEAVAIEDDETHRGLAIVADGNATTPTHWAFGQVCEQVKAPAGYLRTLPAPIAAAALNYGVFRRDVEDTGVLVREREGLELAAVTGPRYGRIWNADVAKQLRERFGDGVTGDFTVPGEFGEAVDVNKRNTTIYASDRDMFVFLADEKNRIEVPGRRSMIGGSTGSMARGFFVWNSEVGSATLGIATFLFDYVCCNRIVWGAQGYEEIKVMHFASAPDRFAEQVAPAIQAYANKSTDSITKAIEDARSARIEGDGLDAFLKRIKLPGQGKTLTRAQVEGVKAAHFAEEDRPIESVWDATVGMTAFAKGIKHQDERVRFEKAAGTLMASASR